MTKMADHYFRATYLNPSPHLSGILQNHSFSVQSNTKIYLLKKLVLQILPRQKIENVWVAEEKEKKMQYLDCIIRFQNNLK